MSRIDGNSPSVRPQAAVSTNNNAPATTNKPASTRPPAFLDGYDQKSWSNLGHYSGSWGGGKTPSISRGGDTLASGNWQWGGSLYSANGSWGQPGGPLFAQGQVNFGQASVSANGNVKADWQHGTVTATGNVDASVYALNAHGQVTSNDFGLGTTKATGYAQVGATANAHGVVAIDPLHGTAMAGVNAEAFAGVRAGVEIQQTVGPVGADAGVKAEAGIGADLHANVGFDHGKFSGNFDVGAALGVGLDLKFGFSFDAGAALKDAGHLLGSVGSGAEHLASGAVHTLGDAAKGAWHALTSW